MRLSVVRLAVVEVWGSNVVAVWWALWLVVVRLAVVRRGGYSSSFL